MKIIQILMLLGLLQPLLFSSDNALSLEEKMQQVLDKEIKKNNVMGVSAAVIYPGNSLWTGVSGISHDDINISPDMVFGIGSITKNMVAALTLRLVEQNILSLESPLSQWLPDYEHIDGSITIRQLLNHTSGIYMFWENQQIWDDLKNDRTKVWSPEEVLQYIKEPYFAAGEGWRYSNTNYLLLAMIIEKATGSDLATEFKEYFWEPLGIDEAYLSLTDDIPDNQAHVYGDNFNSDGSNIDLTFLPRASHESITWGSSGLFMTAEALACWSQALHEGKILQQHSMDEMLQFVEFRPVSNMIGYGLGIQLFKKSISSGKKAIGHSGGNIGTTTYMVYLPEYHFHIVVMTNAYPNKCARIITKKLIRLILKEQKALSLIPRFEFFPFGLFLISCSIFVIINIFIRMKKAT